MKRKLRFYPIFTLIFLLQFGVIHLIAQTNQFANGADIGWLSEMESKGSKFYNDAGTQQDCRQILLDHCFNSIRLRVWVNPLAGFCNKADVVAAAIKASKMGFRLMIDFHYSDGWADPGQQTKPAAWAGYTTPQLIQAIYDHTYDILSTLKANGIYPEWVQVGNETNNGMLWEDGRASASMSNFAKMITSGYNAVKAVSPNSKVVVHIANGFDNVLFRWIFDGLKNNGAKWDVVGMSLYPTTANWRTLTQQCLTNMNDMVTRYSKEVMISEVGLDVSAPDSTYALLVDLIAKTKSITNNKGLGVFYWEPECYNWNGYGKGAWGSNGRPTHAIEAFLLGCSVQKVSLQKGWNYIGCPLKGSTSLASALSSIWTNVESVKNLDSFYSTLNPLAMNLLQNVEWGKGYMIKVTNACVLDWIVR